MDVRSIDQTGQEREAIDRAIRQQIYTCMPGQIESFDDATQTATVLPAVKKRTYLEGKQGHKEYPPIVNVPVIFPFASIAGFAITMPIQPGDPCLIFFSQHGIDNWHNNGGIQEPEEGISARHHSLTDAFVLFAPSPLPQVLGSWQSDGIEIRNRERTTYLKILENSIEAVSNTLSWTMDANGGFSLSAPGGMNVDTPLATFTGDVVAGTVSLRHHVHQDVTPGTGLTGEPVSA